MARAMSDAGNLGAGDPTVSLAPADLSNNGWGSYGDTQINAINPTPASDPYVPAGAINPYAGTGPAMVPYQAPAGYTPQYSPSGYSNQSTPAVSVGGGGAATTQAAPAQPKPTDADAANDSTFAQQSAAYKAKLADYLFGLTNQVGAGNVLRQDGLQGGPGSLDYIDTLKGYGAGDLYKSNLDNNGLRHYQSTGALGGTMGEAYNNAVNNFDLSRNNGLKNMAEDYTARGLGFSGVYGGAKTQADQNYTNQFNNLNNSTLSQYQGLGNDLRTNQDSIEGQIISARNDALGRLNALYSAGLPTTA